ncbi:hypothetical protein [Streptomyces puniciscabiei]|uniref:hypothetical protein n=1 Tax=Streptomyces puniciscabiei TaxID=164348 RepID=UPI0037A80E12
MSAEPATGLSRRTAAAGSDPRIIVAVITRDRPACCAPSTRWPPCPSGRRSSSSTTPATTAPAGPCAATRPSPGCCGPPRTPAPPRAFARATAGLPWVLRRRDPVPPELERRPAALERARRTSPARRYVG